MLATASAASHESHKAMLTPRAGGVIPRPRFRTTNGATRTSAPARTGDHHRRANPRRHSTPAANSIRAASTVSDPAEEVNTPSSGR